MEYERIQKPSSQGGGISPSKLRFMLLGVEKKRKGGEDLESTSALRSERADADDRRVSISDSCKDVASSVAECSTSSDMGGRARKDCPEAESVSFSGVFEFHKAERASSKPAIVPPFSKAAPSKWDDAQKWIASPTSNRSGKGAAQARKGGFLGYGSRQAATKVVVEVSEEPETKRIDLSLGKKEGVGLKSANWMTDHAVFSSSPLADSAVNLSQHSTSVQSTTAFVSSQPTVRSVSMRDMGTEMTPIASQEPSRNGTPVRATTPIRSPTASNSSSPARPALSSDLAHSTNFQIENREEMSETELKIKTRREIMILGTKLGKPNIAAWASKEQDKHPPLSLRTSHADPQEKKAIEMRAAAWEEAEKAKYLARFKREEVKIQAWENLQKAKSEAEMRKVEVKVERIRACAHDKLMNRLAAARQKAEQKRTKAEAKRDKQATKTTEHAEYIRRTGQVPSSFSFSCWSCCS